MSTTVGEIYRKLSRIVDQLELQEDRQISMSEALIQLIEAMKLEPSDFSWSWRINRTWSTEAVNDKDAPPRN